MLFSSMIFLWLFLPVVFILSRIFKGKSANYILLAASLLFYAWGEPFYIFLMVFSIFLNWISGILIERFFTYKKLILILSITANLLLLGYFKYLNMIVDTINAIIGKNILNIPSVALPIGISFFTFQALSYVIDVYRKECSAQKNIVNLALYISFFPQLIAGPIVKYKDINSQIEYREISREKLAEGIRRFTYGLAKKVLISNVLAQSADLIFKMKLGSVNSSMIWLASIFYTFQIYYDFSGYSDMAIGLGKMFGFDFRENFNYPYMALSIREFWRRWHISLSTWFKEYVYIPLGGNRKGTVRTYINLIIVFFLTGVWHGASYNFIFWGLYHGFFSILERLGLNKWLKKNKCLAFLYTFLVVNFGWIFFRIENISRASKFIKKMIQPWNYLHSPYSIWEFVNYHTIFILICAIAGMGLIQSISKKAGLLEKWKFSVPEIIYCTGLLLLSIFALASNTYNPFIYFRF